MPKAQVKAGILLLGSRTWKSMHRAWDEGVHRLAWAGDGLGDPCLAYYFN